MKIKHPLLFGILLCVGTILCDWLVRKGIITYIHWDNSFIMDELWDYYILSMCLISLAMCFTVGNVHKIKIYLPIFIILHTSMWIVLFAKFSYFIHPLTILRMGLTEVVNGVVLFIFIRKKMKFVI
jgi:hypothetical protein